MATNKLPYTMDQVYQVDHLDQGALIPEDQTWIRVDIDHAITGKTQHHLLQVPEGVEQFRIGINEDGRPFIVPHHHE